MVRHCHQSSVAAAEPPCLSELARARRVTSELGTVAGSRALPVSPQESQPFETPMAHTQGRCSHQQVLFIKMQLQFHPLYFVRDSGITALISVHEEVELLGFSCARASPLSQTPLCSSCPSKCVPLKPRGAIFLLFELFLLFQHRKQMLY